MAGIIRGVEATGKPPDKAIGMNPTFGKKTGVTGTCTVASGREDNFSYCLRLILDMPFVSSLSIPR